MATSMTPTVGWSCSAALPLNSGLTRSAQLVIGRPTRSGRMPSVSALVTVGTPVSQSLGSAANFWPSGTGGVDHRVGRHALLRRLASVGIVALGEQRDRLVPVLDLADRDRLQDVPPDQVAQEHDADIGAVERTRLRQEAVQQVGVLHGLHVHGEAEVLGRLLGDARESRSPADRYGCTTTSLMFCAQMVGKPRIAPDPAARPTAAPVPRSTPDAKSCPSQPSS